MTINNDRLAPVFAGSDLWVFDSEEGLPAAQSVSTQHWHPLGWGGELKRMGVELLICAGIDLPTWSALEGHGVAVIPDAPGDVVTVFEAWRAGRLKKPDLWPPNPYGCGRYTGFGKRCRSRGRRRRGGGGK